MVLAASTVRIILRTTRAHPGPATGPVEGGVTRPAGEGAVITPLIPWKRGERRAVMLVLLSIVCWGFDCGEAEILACCSLNLVFFYLSV